MQADIPVHEAHSWLYPKGAYRFTATVVQMMKYAGPAARQT
jgi:hypothetical protein